MKKENLTKKELLKMIDSFELYPAVTDADNKAYILAYLDDEACSISQDSMKKYLNAITITEDNIHLYYEFMSDEEIKEHNSRHSINDEMRYRLQNVAKEISRNTLIGNCKFMLIDLSEDFKNVILYNEDVRAGDKLIGQTIFGVKDTLKPIKEYVAEIKAGSEYIEYLAKKA